MIVKSDSPAERSVRRPAGVRLRADQSLLRRAAASTGVLGVVLTGLSFPPISFALSPGLDPSWIAGLHLAAHRGLDFGSQIVVTYGPLGFLALPWGYFSSTVALSAVYVIALQLGLCVSLVGALRCSLGLPLAVALAFVAARVGRSFVGPELAIVIVFVLCVNALQADRSVRTERLFVALGGAIAGLHLLVKFNAGVTMLAIGALTAWFVGRRAWRSELTFVAAAAMTFLGGWLITGNPFRNIGRFLTTSLQTASGYSEAMSLEGAGTADEYWLAVLVLGALAALVWMGTRHLSLERRIAIALVSVVWLFFALKHGFVRHEGAHALRFFGGVLVIASAFTWRKTATGPVVAAFALFLLSFTQVSGTRATDLLNSLPTLRQAGQQTMTLALPGRRARAITEARQAMQRAYALDAESLRLLEGHTVHIHPWEASVAWAFPTLDWDPLPVFQAYSAYTPALDEVNARFISGPDAPERILREKEAVDSRNPDWESPAATLAMVCHYVEMRTQGRWQVLDRVPARCGDEKPLGVVKTHVGQPVRVPTTSGDCLVVARVRGLDASPLYRVQAQLVKIPTVAAVVNGFTPFRLVPGTASDGLIVRASPQAVGYSGHFLLSSIDTLQIDHARGARAIGLGNELTIEFSAVPVHQVAPDG